MSFGDHTFTVGELSGLLRDHLARAFPTDIWVQGEVRGISRPASGHVYFDLVDPTTSSGQSPDALLSVALMRTTRQIVNRQIKAAGGGVRIADGVNLRIRCAPDFYPPRGQLQLRMNAIDPSYTLGQLAVAREQLLRTLALENLLERNRRLTFPVSPRRIGLVTAGGSAAAADFLGELDRSTVGWHVIIAATPVQGDGAPVRIAAAIRACERRGVDVIAVVRGGGARTDLVAFDHEHVARTIADCSVPVLTGIGHEIDVSVADEVAHLALKTPTACASHLVDLVRVADARTQEMWHEIVRRARRHIERHDDRVRADAAVAGRAGSLTLQRADRRTVEAARTARHLVDRQLERQRATLDRHATTVRLEAAHRLDRADQYLLDAVAGVRRQARHRLSTATRDVDNFDERRRLLDPARVLARGWTITTTAAGRVVRSTADVAPGARITTRVADGSITSTVDAVVDRSIEDHP